MWLHSELCLEKSFWPCGKHVMKQSIPEKRSLREQLISPSRTGLLNAEQLWEIPPFSIIVLLVAHHEQI